jgi:hypothetical protein
MRAGGAAVWLAAAAIVRVSGEKTFLMSKNGRSSSFNSPFLPFLLRFLQLETHRQRRGRSDRVELLSV